MAPSGCRAMSSWSSAWASIMPCACSKGFAASAGDVVIWCGVAVLAAQASVEWQRRRRANALDAAPAAGWLVVDMAKDWATIYPADAK